MDEMEKRKYLIYGINRYDKFLKKNLRMRLNNANEIISKILTNSSENLTHEAHSILLFLENGHKLELAEYLNTYKSNKKESPVLKIDPLTDRLKDLFPFIISTVTVIITLLSFIVGYLLTFQSQNT